MNGQSLLEKGWTALHWMWTMYSLLLNEGCGLKESANSVKIILKSNIKKILYLLNFNIIN